MRCNILIIIMFVFLSMIVCSEEVKILKVEDAVSMAVENNLMVALERISLDTKKRVKDTAWNYFVPQVSLSSTLSRSNEPPVSFSIPGFYDPPPAEHTWKIGFGFSASLSLSASMIYGIKQTIIDYESGVISLDIAKRRITRDVKKMFYNIILMQENIKLMEKNINAMKNRYEQTVSNYNNGYVSEYVMLSTQVAYENAKPGLQDLIIAYDTLLMSFKQLIGLDRHEPVSIKGSIEPEIITVKQSELMDLIEERSDIRKQKKTVNMMKNLKALKQSALYPVLTVMFTMDPTFMGDPFSDNWFANIDDDWSQYSGSIIFRLTVPVDGFLPYSRSQVDISGSDDAIKQAELGLIQMHQAAELEIETTYMKLEKSQNAMDALDLNVRLAERVYSLAEEAYNAGSKELLEVQNSELELNKANIEVLKEKYNYIMGLLDIEYALDISLTEDINEE